MNRPDKNKSRTRLEQREADIVEAATKLFASEGFHGTSTRKIAAAAGVSEGTLFHYYSTKNVLLLAILDDFYAQLISAARDCIENVMGTRERLLLLASNHLRALMDNQALMTRLIQVYLSVDMDYYLNYKKSPLHDLNCRYTRIFDAVIREGMERGYLNPELELSAVRDLFFGGLEYGMRTLMGRKNCTGKIHTYVEELVQPLWESMQWKEKMINPSSWNTQQSLEDTCRRLEKIAKRLENCQPLK